MLPVEQIMLVVGNILDQQGILNAKLANQFPLKRMQLLHVKSSYKAMNLHATLLNGRSPQTHAMPKK